MAIRLPFSLRLLPGDWAFVLTVVAGYASAIVSLAGRMPVPRIVLIIGLGVIYCVIGTAGHFWAEQRGTRGVMLAYFAVQIPLATGIMYWALAVGFIAVIVLPLVGQSIATLPRRDALGVSAVIMLAFLAVVIRLAGLGVALQASVTLLAGVVFVAVFTEIAMREQRVRAQLEDLARELAQANRRLSAYMQQVEELAVAQERNRLAREIHDSLGHYLTVVNVQIQAAQAVLAQDQARAQAALRQAQALTQEGLTEVRRSVAALRAATTEVRPLPELLAGLAEENRAAGIVTEWSLVGAPRPLSPQVELTLFRAAQEALTNVRKHARASRADVTLAYEAAATVRLTVCDNGVGAEATADGQAAFGLLGIRERAQLLGGQVRVQSSPGQGFTLEVALPG